MIVFHVSITTHPDYLARREPHRRAHIERLTGLRELGAVIGGGPAPDGSSVDLVYRLQQPSQLTPAIEEDPYWVGGAWTAYRERSFTEFVEPWQLPPIVLDGSRRVTIVEGRMTDPDMAQFVMIEMRGAGRLLFGGAFPDAATFGVMKSEEAEEAKGWFAETGFWEPESLTARGLLYVL
ncbi:MAG TPA: hypothetical protein VK548_01825 [Candidatus Acidoferrum sp.]|nr:hypothetical protein [Candidatus Acidoferrum sp.]